MSDSFLDTGIEYLKGVGPNRAKLLAEELGVKTFGDLLSQYPFRYVDKTRFHPIQQLTEADQEVQVKGILRRLHLMGEGRKRRLVGVLRDDTGSIDLVWFSGIHWIQKQLEVGKEYIAYGRVNSFRNRNSIPHPEMEAANEQNSLRASTFAPVYPSTEKLRAKGLDSKARRRMMKILLEKMQAAVLAENLPDYLIQKFKFADRKATLQQIHFPSDQPQLTQARNRLKFEELFYLQMSILRNKIRRQRGTPGHVFKQIGPYFNQFFSEKLPFELTGAQKRVLKEIRRDLGSGLQMNRLLQGDVGSGKTIVALMSMLMAIDNDYQACLMAPTEILAQQHYIGITEYLEGLDLEVAFLSGSVKGKKRKAVLEDLAEGRIHILIGTHALLEDPVVFKNLGLAITDEQHRFGVAQRAKLWKKSKPCPPHVLVMTATPIPRTLAMTLYGDLDVSVIDELPPGRKPIKTLHKTDAHRLQVFGFMKEQIKLGYQVYVVYPLIEESETLDLKNLEEGYEAISREFPAPDYQLSIVHGRMKPADKDFEMQRFVEGKTQIMVATTVIEVGVNVPNASVMVIENTERFGLSQLHQLRGRVGRGADQSYCILMSSYKLSKEGKARIKTMVDTTDGFKIAEADLKLRGPGNMQGTQQSGMISLKIANLATDGRILQTARDVAMQILEQDPKLEQLNHLPIRKGLAAMAATKKGWGRIS